MNNFKDLKKNAERSRQLNRQVVDNFMIRCAVSKDRVDKTFEQRVNRYRHIIPNMPKGWKNFLKTQFIAHRIFRADGLIHKYLNAFEAGYRNKEELEYLRSQKEHPWRFSFSEILENPHPDFYTMHDLFTGQEYLLYSPEISDILLEYPDIPTWFILIGSDGMCMQTYGPIAFFRSFGRSDIVFFARKLNPDLETDEDIVNHIEEHPLPYSMLWSGALRPAVVYDDHHIRHFAARYNDPDFESEAFEKNFRVEYDEGVYSMPLKNRDEFPHFATAYYDEREEMLHLIAMTMEGFDKLVEGVNACGYDLPPEPHDNVTPGMLTTASEILKRDIVINPFETPLEPEASPGLDDEGLERVNTFVGLLMEALSNGKKPDVKQMADKTGIDLATAEDITKQLLDRLPWDV